MSGCGSGGCCGGGEGGRGGARVAVGLGKTGTGIIYPKVVPRHPPHENRKAVVVGELHPHPHNDAREMKKYFQICPGS